MFNDTSESMDLLVINDDGTGYPQSWYAATSDIPAPQPRLEGQSACDVCVVGGGYTGLSAALALAESGASVVLLEAKRIGWGASGRNGGQLGGGYNISQPQLEKQLGTQAAHRLWQISRNAVEHVQALIQRHAIDCQYRPGVIAASVNARHLRHSLDQQQYLSKHYQYEELETLDRNELAMRIGTNVYAGGILDHGAGHLHPLKLAYGMADAAIKAGASLFEQSRVISVSEGKTITVHTSAGHTVCNTLIYACNGYLGNLQPAIAKRVMPINNFMVATEPLDVKHPEIVRAGVATFDSRFVVNYFRPTYDGRLLFGGGESYGYRFPRNIEKLVRKPLSRVYPQLKDCRIDYAWGGTLAITTKRFPCFRQVAPNQFSISGYSGHGVALASYAGSILSDLLSGNRADFDQLTALAQPVFPGGVRLRPALLALAMAGASIADRFH